MTMKPIDHSECNPYECIHAMEMRDERKRRAGMAQMEPDKGYAPPRDTQAPKMDMANGNLESGPEWRARKVALLEQELLEARADQFAHGDPAESLQSLRNVVGDALRLLEVKNTQYGDAWRKQGYMGNLARIQSKAARLNALLWRDADGDGYPLPADYTRDGETVIDTLTDLINLAAMMAVNFSEGNRWG
jgi:hypothetical protein